MTGDERQRVLAALEVIDNSQATALAESIIARSSGTTMVEEFLTRWQQGASQPTVLLLDEVDALIGDADFPAAAVARGVSQAAGAIPADGDSLRGAGLAGLSNSRQLRGRPHHRRRRLQHQGQSPAAGRFHRTRGPHLAPETLHRDRASVRAGGPGPGDLTQGQPWLVNALAYETCFEVREGRDRSRPITLAMIEQARENLILRRVTHLDQLAEKLREDRVRIMNCYYSNRIEGHNDTPREIEHALADQLDTVEDRRNLQKVEMHPDVALGVGLNPEALREGGAGDQQPGRQGA